MPSATEPSLFCYLIPPNMYAESAQDIYDYTKAFCDQTSLAVMLFPVPLWGFDRVHESDMDIVLLRRLIDDCKNVAAIKAEGGMPLFMRWVDLYRHFGKEVVISNPLERDMVRLRDSRRFSMPPPAIMNISAR